MILCVGEILVDRLVKENSSVSHIGGAPFNVAVNAYRKGAEVKFFGRVGDDADGYFLKEEAEKYLPDRCNIETDESKKTTVAEVTLTNGERSFKFLRDGAADYAFNTDFDFSKVTGLNIVHLGTLMLNKTEGRKFAEYAIKECDKLGLLLSADANFRDGLFSSEREMTEVFTPILKRADILKVSDEELFILTGERDIEKGILKFAPKGYMFVTMGKRGSVVYKKGIGFIMRSSVPSENVVDTTGAGDAFYGAALACLDGMINKGLTPTKTDLEQILEIGNAEGKAATEREGAL